MHCSNLWVQVRAAVPVKARPQFLTPEVNTASSVRLPLKALANRRQAALSGHDLRVTYVTSALPVACHDRRWMIVNSTHIHLEVGHG